MALHKVKEFFYYDYFWLTSDYMDESIAKTDLFYQLALLFANVTFKDVDNNTIPMDFLEIETDPSLSTNKNGKWLRCTEEYVKVISGDKIASDYFEEAYDEFYNFIQNPTTSSYKISAQWRAKCLALVIFNKFKDNWCRSWYAYSVKYRPLDNYDRTEVVDRDTDTTNTVAMKTDSWDTNKQGSVSSSTNTYGFNSDSTTGGVPVGSSSTSYSNNVAPQNTGIGGTYNSVDEHAVNNHGTDIVNTDEDTTIKVHGNIGVTTSTQMLESELAFREKHNFYNQMYKDIDSILTCNCYGTLSEIGEI